jgi:UDPglucose 6-dehydrogenase
MKVSIVGLGFVGGSILKSFQLKGINCVGYDKYLNGGTGTLEECIDSNVMFLALPTPYNNKMKEYNKEAIFETLDLLDEKIYRGLIVIKSTVEPSTTNKLSERYPNLQLVHNPEFLTASTAFEDFHNQLHIVLGTPPLTSVEKVNQLEQFYKQYYPDAYISRCTAIESESMKLFCNCFYSVKIQFFNELFLTCKKNGSDYNEVVRLMLRNGWINPMHTMVPGKDGMLSYGGFCFPKDTNALNNYMKSLEIPNMVLDSTIRERNQMRNDHTNCE